MGRRKLVAGNWKMNGTRAALAELDGILAAAADHADVDVAIAVPATLIDPAVRQVPGFAIGAQDVHMAAAGPHTGCISAAMAMEVGACFAIVGHSERRAEQCENDAMVKAKGEAAHAAGLWAIVCVGETIEQRDAGEAKSVVTAQVRGSLPTGATADWCALAYEPRWAIGTGRTPTSEEVATMHRAIRDQLREMIGDEADAIRLLYGGSVTGDNARALLHAGDVDGALVGGASLTAEKFVPIIVAAA